MQVFARDTSQIHLKRIYVPTIVLRAWYDFSFQIWKKTVKTYVVFSKYDFPSFSCMKHKQEVYKRRTDMQNGEAESHLTKLWAHEATSPVPWGPTIRQLLRSPSPFACILTEKPSSKSTFLFTNIESPPSWCHFSRVDSYSSL